MREVQKTEQPEKQASLCRRFVCAFVRLFRLLLFVASACHFNLNRSVYHEKAGGLRSGASSCNLLVFVWLIYVLMYSFFSSCIVLNSLMVQACNSNCLWD